MARALLRAAPYNRSSPRHARSCALATGFGHAFRACVLPPLTCAIARGINYVYTPFARASGWGRRRRPRPAETGKG